MAGHNREVGKEELIQLVTEGLDADSIKMLSRYDQAIFENGSPFIGDKMDPIIASS